MESINQTLYINNLNDKVNKNELKRLLYHLFCTYGYIQEIRNSKSGRLRGQAFVVFDKIESASHALRELQGVNFLGKTMKVNFAKTKSHLVQRQEGVFVPPKRIRKGLINNKELG